MAWYHFLTRGRVLLSDVSRALSRWLTQWLTSSLAWPSLVSSSRPGPHQVSHMKEIEKEHVLVLGLGSWEKFIVRVKSFELGYSRTNEQPSPLSEN